MEHFNIQPQKVKVPKGDPFKYDLLKRKEAVETLTSMVTAIRGPCVLAVDAAWGTGKTTFLNIWSQHLRNHGFSVVEFNAWETDFSDDPFVALCSELIGSISSKKSAELSNQIDDVKKKGQVVFRHLTSNALRRVTLGLLDYNTLRADLEKQPEKPQIQQRMDEYQEAKEAFTSFNEALQNIATDLSESGPLMVMIDELDRCRPSYAIELLETAKYLFAVDRMVFVLAINRDQLAHAVRVLYGDKFDAEAYLHRFFDLDFSLPEPALDDFMTELFSSVKISDLQVQMLVKTFLGSSKVSLRDIAQAVHRLGLVLNALTYTDPQVAEMVTVALVLRTLDVGLYRRFVSREASDVEVVEEVMGKRQENLLEWEREDELFQAVIIYAYKELNNDYDTSPLEEKYRNIIGTEKGEEVPAKVQHILELTKEVQRLLRNKGIGFMTANRYLEMFSTR